jgi:hypothetical protein
VKLKDLFERWNLTGLKVKTPILEMEWNPSDPDRDAAWDMYIELLTRVTTQSLPTSQGSEKAALESVYEIFDITRSILKKHGRSCEEFTKISVIVLNQVIRPFTAKWHTLGEERAFESLDKCQEFRTDLSSLQYKIRKYTNLLADLANVEDLTEISVEF